MSHNKKHKNGENAAFGIMSRLIDGDITEENLEKETKGLQYKYSEPIWKLSDILNDFKRNKSKLSKPKTDTDLYIRAKANVTVTAKARATAKATVTATAINKLDGKTIATGCN